MEFNNFNEDKFNKDKLINFIYLNNLLTNDFLMIKLINVIVFTYIKIFKKIILNLLFKYNLTLKINNFSLFCKELIEKIHKLKFLDYERFILFKSRFYYFYKRDNKINKINNSNNSNILNYSHISMSNMYFENTKIFYSLLERFDICNHILKNNDENNFVSTFEFIVYNYKSDKQLKDKFNNHVISDSNKISLNLMKLSILLMKKGNILSDDILYDIYNIKYPKHILKCIHYEINTNKTKNLLIIKFLPLIILLNNIKCKFFNIYRKILHFFNM